MRRNCTLLIFTLVAGMTQWAYAGQIEWRPVSATGAHTIVGNEIFVSPGQNVTLHLLISDWDPELDGSPLLGAYQAGLDPAGYSSGSGVDLAPLTTPNVSAGAFITTKRCTVNQMLSPNGVDCSASPVCPAGEFCVDNPDYVLFNLAPIAAIATVNLGYEFAGVVTAVGAGAADTGVPRYAGTLIVTVPPGAAGTYTIGLVDDPNKTFLIDHIAVAITPVDRVPALITVSCAVDADCDDGNECTTDACNRVNVCVNNLSYNPEVSCCNPGNGALTDLEDGLPCTLGVCNIMTGGVTQSNVLDGTDCDDGLPCSVGESCSAGQCTGGTPDVPSPECSGDFDLDGDRDAADYAEFFDCLDGPDVTPAVPPCDIADFDGLGTVDLADFAAFENVFNGP